jgi:signal transduction histidine kinase/ActR/RegA family two-component response regulator
VQRGLLETANALASGVERELTSTITALETLAESRLLDGEDYDAFISQAQRVLAKQSDHGWLAIHLATPDGTPLTNTSASTGRGLPLPETTTVKQTAVSKSPLVTDLLADAVRGQRAFAVRVPVVRNNAVKYVLTAQIAARSMIRALQSQQDVRDRIAVLFDRRGMIVFRTLNPEGLTGAPVTPRLAQASAEHASGVIDDVNREGTPVRTVFQRSSMSGWTVAVGIPQTVLYAAQRRSLRQVAVVGTILLALTGAATLVVARTIRRHVAALVIDAERLNARHDVLVPHEMPITELRRLADALGAAGRLIRERGAALEQQLKELRTAREESEAANRTKDQFLATLSHELRTPLNAVFGWARMMQTGHIPPQGHARALDAIIRNADAQLRLIDDLLDISRIVAGKLRLDVQSVDLKSVVENALDAVRPAAHAKGIQLQPILDPRIGMIVGDPARLQQVVWNLLINAVKFTGRDGRVQAQLHRVNSHVEIVISDTGQGIAPELLPFVFDRFRQGDGSMTRPHPGLGLGLALVKHIVELHGGTVVAQSGGESKGSTFIVRLPVALAQISAGRVPRVHPTTATIPTTAGARLDGIRVLVVDDDVDAQELAMAILTAAGGVVRTCASAEEAFVTLQEWRPDVLVSDIEMPGEDGYGLIRRVRALDVERGARTPAIALTAYGRTQDRIQTLSAGYDMHVPKPVDPGELTTIIATVASRAVQS